MPTAPSPSTLASRVCMRSTWAVCKRSSGVSSMVMTRSPAGMKPESAPSNVVLPEPVPPEITMGQRACTAAQRKSAMAADSAPTPSRSSMLSMPSENVRTLSAGPSGEMGGTTYVARALPPGSIAHPMACVSSQRMPACSAILLMMRRTWSASSKTMSGRCSINPARSTYTTGARNGSAGSASSTPPPLTMISVTAGSSSRGCSGP